MFLDSQDHESDHVSISTSETRKMEVETRSVERQVVGMTICGFEVARCIESWGVPETTAKVS